MKEKWSQLIHSPRCLFECRQLRFRDEMKSRFTDAFSIDASERIRILEIGCGSGCFCKSLSEWYPNAFVVGLDADPEYISFASSHVKGVTFCCRDFKELKSFVKEYGLFDYVFTHSMFGFVNTDALIRAVLSVLREGGRVITINNKLSMGLRSRLWEPLCPEFEELARMDAKIGLLSEKRAYTTAEVVLELERHGIRTENVDYVAVPLMAFGEDGGCVMEMYRSFQWNRLEMICRRNGCPEYKVKELCVKNDKLFASKYSRGGCCFDDGINVDVLEIIKSKLPCARQRKTYPWAHTLGSK